jgi:hypothetical protein
VTVSNLKIGKQEYVVLSRKEFDRLSRRAEMFGDDDAMDVIESLRRLKNPREKRISWKQVKNRAGIA